MITIKQFLADVNWGELDYLIVDSPPGTGDEPLSVCQLIPNINGAIIVTTPQEVAILDSRKRRDTINEKVKAFAHSFAEEMSLEGFTLDFSYRSLEIEIDKILMSKNVTLGGDEKTDWKNEAGLEAYVGETLASLFRGVWKGEFDYENPAGNFYTSYVEFGEFRYYPSHFLSYRITNGPEEGTFRQNLEKVMPKIKYRKGVS